MTPGILIKQRLAATQTVTASTTLVDLAGFTFPIKNGQKIHYRIKAPFTVGATGGFKFRLDGPAAPSNYNNIQEVNDGVTATPGAQIVSVITALADFANAFASVAGNHSLAMEGDFVASADGNVKLQFACNSAAGAISVLQGAYLEITIL